MIVHTYIIIYIYIYVTLKNVAQQRGKNIHHDGKFIIRHNHPPPHENFIQLKKIKQAIFYDDGLLQAELLEPFILIYLIC